MEKQKTISRDVSLSGIALHTGNETKITFRPAPPDTGIRFVRTDIPGGPVVKAHIGNVADVVRGTNIKEGGAKLYTIEHIMAALLGVGIDNLVIEMNASEPPVGDGSAMPFLEKIREAGVSVQDAPKKMCALKESIWVGDNGSMIVAMPCDRLVVSCTISFDHPEVKAQFITIEVNEETFEKMIAPSRTFCFYNEVEHLMDKGLIKGGSLDNAVVIGDNAIFSKEKLRFNDEFVRHKILDLLGDIYLIGRPLFAHIIAIMPGHTLNIKLARRLYELFMKKTEVRKDFIYPSEDDPGMDINQIMNVLPHRYPFLLVDRIIGMTENKAVGIKNVTINEPFFNGHFPGRPIMPGVLLVEAMAQVGGILMLKKSENMGKIAYFMSMNNVKFRRVVTPGDQIRFEIELTKVRGRTGRVHGDAYVGANLAAEADLTFTLVDA